MMIAPNSHARKEAKERGEVKGEYEGIWQEEEEGNADCGGMVQHSQQHDVPCGKGAEWRLGTRGLRMVANLPVEVAQEAGVVPHCYFC